MQNRLSSNGLFTLPKEVFEDLILSRVASLTDRKAALCSISISIEQAELKFARYLSRVTTSNGRLLQFIAGLSRADAACFLRQFYASNTVGFNVLQQQATASNAGVLDYACYALVAKIAEIDRERLRHAVAVLESQHAPETILNSLKIVDACIAGDNEALSASILKGNAAHINLRGARITADLSACDLSYADLQQTQFLADCTHANLEGANFTNAFFDSKTVFESANTTGINITGVTLGHGFIIEYDVNAESGQQVLVVPELLPLIVVDNEDPRPSSNCSIM